MNDKEVYIILDNIKYAQNIGPIFRTADAFCVKKVFLCRNNFHKLNPCQQRILHKASRGATDWVDWEFRDSSSDLIKELKSAGVNVVCIETGNNSKLIKQAKFKFPLAMVFGSEDSGISEEVLKQTDFLVKIPMYGKGKSLNVSTSVGIAVYEVFHSLE